MLFQIHSSILTLNFFFSFDLVKSVMLSVDVNSASLSPDAKTFVVGGSSDFWSRVHDYATGAEIGSIHYFFFALF
jgi:hypothetical protein